MSSNDTPHDAAGPAPAATAPDAPALQLGLNTFGDVTRDADGALQHPAVTLREVLEQGVVADQAGVDVLGIGEHHRPDFAVSAPDVVLAAIAGRTTRLRLASAVTVLSSDDPVRVFQRFATLDGLSGGRAEVILGRGSFTESFPLFGYDLSDYEVLFTEKLDLFSHLLAEEPVTWSGSTRAPMRGVEVHPRTASGGLTTWIGVGGNPESVVRAARYGMPLMMAIIGGPAHRFAPLADLYRRALTELGQGDLPIGVHSPGHVADTDARAREELWPHYEAMYSRLGRERGWGPTTRAHFEAEADEGALYVGSPETVARKIAESVRALGIRRFDLKYATGPMPHAQLVRSIELYGTKVGPMVRDMLA
ncbi:luciferase [Actinotalea ferrariae CF5-4]|uniref:Luciferase n=1 Tax=Actinotalea ferrariae CF5-4 TaxID=948458 RepID=A0A021VP05_9CELL|nr:LLM class flavin-dependent oxidoreductase [Actinotalea ferrariae]EYR62909.1 luciferase [Actinotalea ferrariae CF5-4]